MVNQRKIVTMTRLALYDKHEGSADRAANDYFRHDYIYRNNLGTRLAVGVGSIIILLVYWLQNILVNETDLFELNFRQIGTDSLMFMLAVLAVYSLIGTIQGTRQYYLVQKRLAQYQALVRQLERLEERAQRVYDDETETNPAAHTVPPKSRPPAGARPAPLPGHTAPLVRTGGPGPAAATGQSTAGRMPAGYTRPPRHVPPDATRPPRSMPQNAGTPPRPLPQNATVPPPPRASETARVTRPIPADSTLPPRPMPPGATLPPRPVPQGYTRPRSSAAPSGESPPPPRPMPPPATPPGDSTESEL